MLVGKTLFAQVMEFQLPWKTFHRLATRYQADYRIRTLTCADQFRVMAFAQLTFRESLRDIEVCLSAQSSKLYHMGIRAPVSRSTLPCANEHRSWRVHQAAFYGLLARGRALVEPRKKLRFKNKLLSLDATTIDLRLDLFPWAGFRGTKGAVKLHMLLDHDGYLPLFADITTGKTDEVKVAQRLSLPRGNIVVFDRGYSDYRLFNRLSDDSVFFVTRCKRNAVRTVESVTESPPAGVLADELVCIPEVPFPLRRVVVAVPDKDEPLVRLTNHLAFGATTIGRIYKERWQIEIFFKTLSSKT